MKVLAHAIAREEKKEVQAINQMENSMQMSEATSSRPDYTEMMIEVQKIGDPVSFESLKDFYNIE
ncbi:MAG: hypothetical protein R8P61_29070 [Bacteroidia bacterium]|nr:hypothetical protein [Bacteroidia bacterium]